MTRGQPTVSPGEETYILSVRVGATLYEAIQDYALCHDLTRKVRGEDYTSADMSKAIRLVLCQHFK